MTEQEIQVRTALEGAASRERLADLENTADQMGQYIRHAQEREHMINNLRDELYEARLKGEESKLELFDEIVHERPVDPTYWDMHRRRELLDEIAATRIAAAPADAKGKETK